MLLGKLTSCCFPLNANSCTTSHTKLPNPISAVILCAALTINIKVVLCRVYCIMYYVYLLYICHREERPPSLSYCCHGISNSGQAGMPQNKTIDDKEVVSA